MQQCAYLATACHPVESPATRSSSLRGAASSVTSGGGGHWAVSGLGAERQAVGQWGELVGEAGGGEARTRRLMATTIYYANMQTCN